MRNEEKAREIMSLREPPFVVVFGMSDDHIEIDGTLREEIFHSGEPGYLAFSNGVVLHVLRDRYGIWRISPRAGASVVETFFPTGEVYSDIVLLPPATWLVHGYTFSNRARKDAHNYEREAGVEMDDNGEE